MSRAAAAVKESVKEPEKLEDPIQQDLPLEPEIEVVVAGEAPPEPEKKDQRPPQEQDDRTALQKQLDELKAAEAAATAREEETARQLAEERRRTEYVARERDGYRSSSAQSQLDAIDNALVAAQSEAEAATREIEAAVNAGNTKLQSEAYRRLAKAESNIGRLEDGKAELESAIERFNHSRRQEQEREPEPQRQERQEQPGDIIDRMSLPARAKDWLKENRQFVENPRQNAKLMAAHWDALDDGHKEFSTDYFVSLETKLGLREAEKIEAPAKQSDPPKRAPIVSAPVNRDPAPGSPGGSKTRVELTKEEIEHARIAGISDVEYAKQKLRLEEMKKQGHYGETR